MKNLILALALAVAFAGCKKDKEDKAVLTVSAPTATIAVTPATLTQAVAVDVEASEGLEKMLVRITSTSAPFTATLAAVGLSGEFDMMALNEMQAATLAAAGVVPPAKGAKTWKFVLTPFLGMMYKVDTDAQGTGVFTAKFDITAVDAKANRKSAAVNLDFKAQ